MLYSSFLQQYFGVRVDRRGTTLYLFSKDPHFRPYSWSLGTARDALIALNLGICTAKIIQAMGQAIYNTEEDVPGSANVQDFLFYYGVTGAVMTTLVARVTKMFLQMNALFRLDEGDFKARWLRFANAGSHEVEIRFTGCSLGFYYAFFAIFFGINILALNFRTLGAAFWALEFLAAQEGQPSGELPDKTFSTILAIIGVAAGAGVSAAVFATFRRGYSSSKAAAKALVQTLQKIIGAVMCCDSGPLMPRYMLLNTPVAELEQPSKRKIGRRLLDILEGIGCCSRGRRGEPRYDALSADDSPREHESGAILSGGLAKLGVKVFSGICVASFATVFAVYCFGSTRKAVTGLINFSQERNVTAPLSSGVEEGARVVGFFSALSSWIEAVFVSGPDTFGLLSSLLLGSLTIYWYRVSERKFVIKFLGYELEFSTSLKKKVIVILISLLVIAGLGDCLNNGFGTRAGFKENWTWSPDWFTNTVTALASVAYVAMNGAYSVLAFLEQIGVVVGKTFGPDGSVADLSEDTVGDAGPLIVGGQDADEDEDENVQYFDPPSETPDHASVFGNDEDAAEPPRSLRVDSPVEEGSGWTVRGCFASFWNSAARCCGFGSKPVPQQEPGTYGVGHRERPSVL